MFTMAVRQNRIPLLLKEKEMTVYALAKAMQMPYHNVKTIATAPVIPDGTNYKTLRKVAEVLGVGIDDLEALEE